MKSRLTLALLLGLSTAALTAGTQGQTGRGTTDQERIPTRTMQPADVLGTVCAIDSNEIHAANLILNRDLKQTGVRDTGTVHDHGTGDRPTGEARGNDPYGSGTGNTGNTDATGRTGDTGTTGTTGTPEDTRYDDMRGMTGEVQVSTDVREYATMVFDHHQQNLQKTMALAKQLNVQVSFTGPQARQVKTQGKQELMRLKSLKKQAAPGTYGTTPGTGQSEDDDADDDDAYGTGDDATRDDARTDDDRAAGDSRGMGNDSQTGTGNDSRIPSSTRTSRNEFEHAFIQSMVTGHQNALKVIDQISMGVTDEQIRQHMAQFRSTVQDHLERAQELQQGPVSRR